MSLLLGKLDRFFSFIMYLKESLFFRKVAWSYSKQLHLKKEVIMQSQLSKNTWLSENQGKTIYKKPRPFERSSYYLLCIRMVKLLCYKWEWYFFWKISLLPRHEVINGCLKESFAVKYPLCNVHPLPFLKCSYYLISRNINFRFWSVWLQ